VPISGSIENSLTPVKGRRSDQNFICVVVNLPMNLHTMHELDLTASGHPSRSDEGWWRARCRTDAKRSDAKYNLNNHARHAELHAPLFSQT
jgi:hypothetical protein